VRLVAGAVALALQLVSSGAGGETAPTGEAVLEKARAVLSGVRDKSMRVTMRVRAPSGDERVRILRGYEKHDPEARKVLWIFDSPQELEGTGFLAWQNEGSPDSLWVYFPGQRRVRRVPPSIRRENFQGSMFTYEDLVAVFFLDFEGTHRLEGESEYGESRCWIVETTLPEGEFAYRRLRTSIDRETRLPTRVDFYADGLLKTMLVTRTEIVGGIPTILEVEMRSPTDGYRTLVELAEIDYNRGLADNLFTIEHLSQMGD